MPFGKPCYNQNKYAVLRGKLMPVIEVRNRIVGVSPDAPQLPTIVLDLLHEKLTTAELIASTVEEQIRDLLINRKIDMEQARATLNRQYLTDDEARQMAERGAIRYRTAEPADLPQIDTPTEIQRALEGFKQRAYLIYVDGVEAESLDDVLTFSPNSKVTFLRLTPLVGG
jgi:hypothetical protein